MQFGADIEALWGSEEDSTQLFEVARRVEELTAHPGWRAVHDLIDKQRERAMARLIHSGERPEPQLRRDLGLMAGLDQASLAAHAIVEGAERLRRRFDEETAAESVAEGSQT